MSDISTTASEEITRAFRDHGREVRNFLHGQLKCRHTADDLVQETYLRLMRAPATQPVKDWRALIFRVARNLAIDHLRSRGRRSHFEQELEVLYAITDERPEMDDALVTAETLAQVEAGFESLPAASREVFELCRREGLSHPQIADRLGISVRTVARHMAHAMQLLRKRIEG